MSSEKQGQEQGAGAESISQETSFLADAIKATKKTDSTRAKSLIKTFVEEATKGTLKFDKNITRSIRNAIADIDSVVSKQLSTIMHHPDFQKLEGSWRGLEHLIKSSETGTQLKIKVMNCSKDTLRKDLEKAVEFDQSEIFKKIYTDEFGTAGGVPFGALVGDYEFTNHPDDVALLRNISGVAAAGFCPFISAASPELFGFDDWRDLNKPRDLAKIFDSVEYTAWNSLRQTEDSRFLVLTMPRTLARLPYGKNTKPIDEFGFEEVELGEDGDSKTVDHSQYCWMNTAYVMGSRLTDAFAQYGWCTAIRGKENGGLVQNLPTHVVTGEDGDKELKCPTEISISDRRNPELFKLGFSPLCHYKGTDHAVFFGGQTVQKPKTYEGKDGAEATANAAMSARLPYLMACSRIAHYLKVIARDKIGSFMERADCEQWLHNWIMNYVTSDPNPSPETKARYPLSDASIQVVEIPGQPGDYQAIAQIKPWVQLESLTTSMRLVTKIRRKE
jgi:type VI secretion system protein ImpC